MDFTIKTYKRLLEILQNKGYVFQSFVGHIQNPEKKVIILRHDVDKLPENSLNVALLESSLSVKGSYYFRIVPCSYNKEIINKVAELGHEIGYHYEDISLTAQRLKGTMVEEKLIVIAIELFKENLNRIREIVPVKTICMHGSPMSRWDSRLLWKYYDYRDFGIIGEPYFDVDFDQVLYLTDTGRRWDGKSVNIRDKTEGGRQKAVGKGEWGESGRMGEKEIEQFDDSSLNAVFSSTPRPLTPSGSPKFHSTFDIIKAAEEDKLPDKIMMTFHPQRWTDKPVPWVRELVWQNVKNAGKYFLIRLSR